MRRASSGLLTVFPPINCEYPRRYTKSLTKTNICYINKKSELRTQMSTLGNWRLTVVKAERSYHE
jgi:hypothetical protein